MGTLVSLIFQINIYEHLLWTRHKAIFWKSIRKQGKQSFCSQNIQSVLIICISFLPLTLCTTVGLMLSDSISLAPTSPVWVPPQRSTGGIGGREKIGYSLPSYSTSAPVTLPLQWFPLLPRATLSMVPDETMDSWELPLHVFSSELVILDFELS